MQGVRAPTDPSHWHAATRVLPARVQRICRPTRNVHRARKPSCASSAANTVVSTRSDHFIATLSPPCVRSNICQSSREGSWRHRWQWIRQTPIAAPRLASSRILRARRRHVSTNQDGAPSAQPKMVHLRHNHDGAPSAQPSCCTSRVNRESARTGNIARPFVVTVDDVSPTQPPRRPGDCGPSRC